MVSKNIQSAAEVTVDEDLFVPCTVGRLESQFLKMMAKTEKSKKCLHIGCFTGSSATAFAEGSLAAAIKRDDGTAYEVKIHTLESDKRAAEAAKKTFLLWKSSVQTVTSLHHEDATT